MRQVDVIEIEVAYAGAACHELLRLHLPAGATLREALEASGLLRKYPEIDLSSGRFGIHAKLCNLDTMLRTRDRVEIYRPLIADPKEIRRMRAERGKASRKFGGPKP